MPTAAEPGYPELTFDSVVGFFGWRDMSTAIKERIAADIGAIVAEPAFRARLVATGTNPRTGTARSMQRRSRRSGVSSRRSIKRAE